MCGRITLTLPDRRSLAEALGLPVAAVPEDYRPRYNVAPGQVHWIRTAGDPPILGARWGLVPHWARDEEIGRRTINARAETAARKPAFRDAFRRRRCLVLADGFYEWHGPKGRRTPYWIHPAAGGLLALAGLFDRWQPPGGAPPLWTFTVLTCPAHPAIARLHDRMPVMLARRDWPHWLDPATTRPEPLADLLVPRLPCDLELRPVDRRVGNVRFDDPALLEPAGPSTTARAGDGGHGAGDGGAEDGGVEDAGDGRSGNSRTTRK